MNVFCASVVVSFHLLLLCCRQWQDWCRNQASSSVPSPSFAPFEIIFRLGLNWSCKNIHHQHYCTTCKEYCHRCEKWEQPCGNCPRLLCHRRGWLLHRDHLKNYCQQHLHRVSPGSRSDRGHEIFPGQPCPKLTAEPGQLGNEFFLCSSQITCCPFTVTFLFMKAAWKVECFWILNDGWRQR